MKRYTYLYYLLLSVTVLAGCKKMLEPRVDNTFAEDINWKLPNKAEGVLIDIYADIPSRFDFYNGNNFLDAATDNAVTNNFNSGIYRLGSGALAANDNPLGDWTNLYNQIAKANQFIEKGLTANTIYDIVSTANDSIIKRKLRGEAYFLRAWNSFQLLQLYGGKTNAGEALGYPISTKVLTDAEAKNLNITRNTYQECAAQIMNDCDSAVKYLPTQYAGTDAVFGIRNLGRADLRVAAALKAKTALYAASPAYQTDAVTKITAMGQFSVVDAAEYNTNWIRATESARQAIVLIGNFTSLKPADFSNPVTPADFIWRRFHNNNFMEYAQYPPHEYGDAVTGPSQNLVESFPALNGYPITDARSGYSAQNPYANRDPRLSMNVYFNSALIDGREVQLFDGGLDARSRYFNASRTGYYLKKWLSVKSDLLNPLNPLLDFHYYVMLRKTEVYLNFAEAANEAYGPNVIPPGASFSASTVIKNIRKGAGLTAATSDAYVNEVAALGKDAFRNLIQNERRLELAFENHRYFDLRRWVLPLNATVKGVVVTKTGSTYSYAVQNVEDRKLDMIRNYYLPLPYTELSKSPSLVNNFGW
ncbi:RagB/SusD family nutrient uptake outer membrane protein [Lacibacter sp.]|uniref:RagB/SusD family nutrient uptake outer membrane protein n=1 Tax=Lacibacter sp. TaxID=1915409 RepID=UPI002B4B063F|nr:RagB/SusD family nutrient uptake outer membrane protein [Lacibacter sp.]HLP37710.1 RagB/SusD family nutrient uptake outer membrane protein [Lacibacter sp.]